MTENEQKPKIYCFVHADNGRDWYDIVGIAEDGHVLSGHISSSVMWAKHDIGITSDWKHEQYKEHYPDGYELIWVDDYKEIPKEVFELNKKLGERESE